MIKLEENLYLLFYFLPLGVINGAKIRTKRKIVVQRTKLVYVADVFFLPNFF